MPNPLHCNEPAHRHGKTRAGSARYRCRICGTTFTPEKLQWGGHNAVNPGEAMTGAERDRRYRERKRLERMLDRQVE